MELYKQFTTGGETKESKKSTEDKPGKGKKWATVCVDEVKPKVPEPKAHLTPVNKKEYVKRKMVKTDTCLLPREVHFSCLNCENNTADNKPSV